jgi:hypothetical protein
MILKQIAFFLFTNFLRDRASSTNWIADSTKAITYTAVTGMFLTKLSALLKKSIVVIPLSIFGSVLMVLCYSDLMSWVDGKINQIQPSFVINLIGVIVCFTVAYFALNSSDAKDEEPAGEASRIVESEQPLQTVGVQVQENISFFKRGFAQAFEKTHDTTD